MSFYISDKVYIYETSIANTFFWVSLHLSVTELGQFYLISEKSLVFLIWNMFIVRYWGLEKQIIPNRNNKNGWGFQKQYCEEFS